MSIDTSPLAEKIKAFEEVESKRKADPNKPLIARLDGRAFHTFTEGLPRPYDARLSDLMIRTTKYLMTETNAEFGYTQSDEISLYWSRKNDKSTYMFDGRFQKMSSILSAIATGYFVSDLRLGVIPERMYEIPTFDARVFQVDTFEDVKDCFKWRQKDAIKNSITMAAFAKFGHKKIEFLSGTQKKAMLSEAGVPWENEPNFFKYGTYCVSKQVFKELDELTLSMIPEKFRPTGPILRNEKFCDSIEDITTVM